MMTYGLVCSSVNARSGALAQRGRKEPPRRAETQERGNFFFHDSTAAWEQTNCVELAGMELSVAVLSRFEQST